jgi:hypothetical protein
MLTHDPMALLVRAYAQERLREAERERLCRLARQGGTRVRPAARLRVQGAIAILAALVAMVALAALLVVSGRALALG